jgi:hypothetical protein
MGRLVDVRDAQRLPSQLTLQPGDVLLCAATGGHVLAGEDVVEMIGAFLPAVLGEHGQVLTPMGAPNTVLFRALRPGLAKIDVITGDPWRDVRTTTLTLTVES